MVIRLTKSASKQLKNTPSHIQRKFEYWMDLIKDVGLIEARKYKGFHDEKLSGKRVGQRSIRLSRSYRIIYLELKPNCYEIMEITKHEY